MKNMLQQTQNPGVILKEARVHHQHLSLNYRLIAVQSVGSTHYEIEVALEDEIQSSDLGTDIECALWLFHTLLQGGVTPCVLKEILLDMQTQTPTKEKNGYLG